MKEARHQEEPEPFKTRKQLATTDTPGSPGRLRRSLTPWRWCGVLNSKVVYGRPKITLWCPSTSLNRLIPLKRRLHETPGMERPGKIILSPIYLYGGDGTTFQTTTKRVRRCVNCRFFDGGFCQNPDVRDEDMKIKWSFNQPIVIGCTKGKLKGGDNTEEEELDRRAREIVGIAQNIDTGIAIETVKANLRGLSKTTLEDYAKWVEQDYKNADGSAQPDEFIVDTKALVNTFLAREK